MLKQMLKIKKNQKGFTLVELMVVLLIIGILIAVAVPVFLGARTRAQDNVAEQIVTNSARAIASYYAAENKVPATGPSTGIGTSLKEEEGTYTYTDAAVAPAFVANPAAVAYERTSDAVATVRTTSQSGTVKKIIVTNGAPAAIVDGN